MVLAQGANLLAQVLYRFFVLLCTQWIKEEGVMKNKLIVLSTVMLVLVLVACNSVQPTTPNQPRQTGLGVQPQATTSGALAAPQSTNNAGESMSGPVPTGDANTQLDSPAVAEAKIKPTLREAMKTSKGNIDFCVILSEQAIVPTPEDGMSIDDIRGQVIDLKMQVAARTHPPVETAIKSLMEGGTIANYSSFWAFNGFCVTGKAQAVQMLAVRSDVRTLEFSEGVTRDPYPASTNTLATATPVSVINPTDPGPVEGWNIRMVEAPAAWFVSRGRGAVVGIIDSGVDATNPDLSLQWRGLGPSGLNPAYNWRDYAGSYNGRYDNSYPYDDSGHGTLVAGLAVGGSVRHHVGVAPDAKWIACKALDYHDQGTAEARMKCLQWMALPTDENDRVTSISMLMIPDVVSGSYGHPNPDEAEQLLVQTLRDEQILPVFAVSNGDGSSAPGYPAGYPESMAVGAVLSNRAIAPYSNVGDGKPDIVAPGGNDSDSFLSTAATRRPGMPSDSCSFCVEPNNPDGLRGFSKTSAAAPHVAGVAALLRGYDHTISVNRVESILKSSAYFEPSWGTKGSSRYGWGIVNAWRAVDAASGGTNQLTATYVALTTMTPAVSATANRAATGIALQTRRAGETGTAIAWNATVTAIEGNSQTQAAGATQTASIRGTQTAVAGTQTAQVRGTQTAQAGATFTAAGPTLTNNAGWRTEFPATLTAAASQTPAATPPLCPLSFDDLPTSHLFYTDIIFLSCRGILDGYGNNRFYPNDPASRGQFAKAAVLAYGVPSYVPAGGQTFSDVPPTSAFFGYVESVAHAGVVNGLNAAQCNGLGVLSPCYGPNAFVSRGQVAIIITRTRNYQRGLSESPFADVQYGHYAYDGVTNVWMRSIMQGAACSTGGGSCFRPNDSIMRGELTAAVHRSMITP